MLRFPYFFLEGKTQQGQPSGSQPDLNILLQKILEDIEKLEKSGVYIATLNGLLKLQEVETLLSKMKDSNHVAGGSKEEEIPALLKRSALEKAQEEARDLNLEEGWQQVPNRTKYSHANSFKQKQGGAPATRINKPRVGGCKQSHNWAR